MIPFSKRVACTVAGIFASIAFEKSGMVSSPSVRINLPFNEKTAFSAGLTTRLSVTDSLVSSYSKVAKDCRDEFIKLEDVLALADEGMESFSESDFDSVF